MACEVIASPRHSLPLNWSPPEPHLAWVQREYAAPCPPIAGLSGHHPQYLERSARQRHDVRATVLSILAWDLPQVLREVKVSPSHPKCFRWSLSKEQLEAQHTSDAEGLGLENPPEDSHFVAVEDALASVFSVRPRHALHRVVFESWGAAGDRPTARRAE